MRVASDEDGRSWSDKFFLFLGLALSKMLLLGLDGSSSNSSAIGAGRWLLWCGIRCRVCAVAAAVAAAAVGGVGRGWLALVEERQRREEPSAEVLKKIKSRENVGF